jgi:hypothetical protein
VENGEFRNPLRGESSPVLRPPGRFPESLLPARHIWPGFPTSRNTGAKVNANLVQGLELSRRSAPNRVTASHTSTRYGVSGS